MRILISDDHAVVRKGIRQILAESLNAEFAEAADSRETIELSSKGHWDLILIDINMPGRSGLDVLGDLKAYCPDTPILVVSMHEEEQFAPRVLQAGAAGYINKSSMSKELIKAVKKVLAGGSYVSEKFAEYLAKALRSGTSPGSRETLSAREFEVLRMIAAGKSGKEIAHDLSLSFKTISTYRTRLLHKLDIRSNAELGEYAAREGLA
ncbi:MAG: two-component system, NarL family, invasion response regulator UvrY [Verrucomicrobiota bacterium]|jgi:DNA-binding NarL/FixJ family response regulator